MDLITFKELPHLTKLFLRNGYEECIGIKYIQKNSEEYILHNIYHKKGRDLEEPMPSEHLYSWIVVTQTELNSWDQIRVYNKISENDLNNL